MTTRLTDPTALRHRMVATLLDTGTLRSPRWIAAFRAVPREKFVDRFVAVDAARGQLTEHDLAGADPIAALNAVYADTSLLTQFDDGGTATSSSTAPSLMALMLEHLDAHPGHRVLEIGTGTGYNAAVLCHALGSTAVTTMDIHPQLLTRATNRLAELGYTPRVRIGDGRHGAPEHGPYDRIIATCGFDRVPIAWRSQLTAAGVVAINIGFGLAILHANPTGLTGRFVDQAAFMAARVDTADTAYTTTDALTVVCAGRPGGRQRASVWPDYLDNTAPAITFLRSVVLPGITYIEHHPDRPGGQDTREVILVDPVTESWTVATATEDGQALLVESGPRRLWTELVALATRWNDDGRPTPDRYGLTVGWDGTHVLWLDAPDQTVHVLPATGSATEQSDNRS